MATQVTFQKVKSDFHSIDRQAYHRLLIELGLASCCCKRIVAFWNWLERKGYRNFVSNTLPLPEHLLRTLVSETTKCLNCLTEETCPIGDDEVLPVMSSVACEDISQGIVCKDREHANFIMASFMQNVIERTIFLPQNLADGSQPSTSDAEDVQEQDMVAGQDQEQANNTENGPALFARVVVTTPQYIGRILGERELVQVNICGKDVRIRRFVDRRAAIAPPNQG